MTNRRLSRRRLLLGAGGAALALPLFESLMPAARAASGQWPLRLIIFFHEAGTLVDEWKPKGTGTNFDLSSGLSAGEGVLSPLSALQQKLVVVSGLSTPTAELPSNLSGHGKSKVGLLTGEGVFGGGAEGWANGPSVEQVVAERIGAVTPKRSVDVQIGETHISTDSIVSFSGPNQPVTSREADPAKLFASLFSGLSTPTTDPSAAQRLARDKSVLHAVKENFASYRKRLGSADRQRLDAHAAYVQDIEQRLSASGSTGGGCVKPNAPGAVDVNEHDATGKLFSDMLAMAFACDLTRVATIGFNTTHNYQFPWTGVSIPYAGSTYGNWHDYIHDSVENQAPQHRSIKRAILRWHMDQLAYLLTAMDNIPEGDGTVLDHSLVVSLSDHGDAAYHNPWDLPVILAGGACGALKGGRHLNFPGGTNNDLLVSILNLCGYSDKSFGRAEFCDGGLSGLA